MNTVQTNWSNAPLFHAATNVINTPTFKASAEPCAGAGFTPRLNVGNIHEIKRYWQQLETAQTVK